MNYIPCMITIGNFICGLLAIHSLLYHNIHSAVLFIFTGMFLDFFDGMAARKLNAVSDMGRELDSFADLVTFGVASFYACLQCRVVYPAIYRDLMRIDVQHLRNASPL